MKTDQSPPVYNFKNKKNSEKRISRSSSQETEQVVHEDIKTMKKTDVIKKKSYFDEWEMPLSRGPSAEKKIR